MMYRSATFKAGTLTRRPIIPAAISRSELGTRGIDQFIGEPKLISQGHGTAFIRLFVESLFKVGAPRIITDPNPRNSRAIRAYAKAGFKEIDRRMTISGEALLMARDALPSESLVSL